MGWHEDKRILHGNLAKVEPDKNRVLPQDYRPPSEPDQYGFESLPGSSEDLMEARSAFKKGAEKQQN